MSPKKKGSRILYPATKTRINMSKRTKRRSTGTCDEYKDCLPTKWQNDSHCPPTFQNRGTLERSPENMSPTSEPRLHYGFLWLFLFLHPSSRQSLQAKITYIVKSWHCFQVCDNLNFQKKMGLSHLRSSNQKNLWKISRNSVRETVSVEWLSSWCVAVKMSTTPSTQAGSGRHCWDTTGSVQRTGLAIHLCNV